VKKAARLVNNSMAGSGIKAEPFGRSLAVAALTPLPWAMLSGKQADGEGMASFNLGLRNEMKTTERKQLIF
jgi:hypothetical protein